MDSCPVQGSKGPTLQPLRCAVDLSRSSMARIRPVGPRSLNWRVPEADPRKCHENQEQHNGMLDGDHEQEQQKITKDNNNDDNKRNGAGAGGDGGSDAGAVFLLVLAVTSQKWV